jgi:hypothetical protein
MRYTSTYSAMLALLLALAQPTLAQIAPPPPALSGTVSREATAQSQGSVERYLINPHGDVDGLLLSNGMQIHFPPHMGDELVAAVKPTDAVSVEGFRRLGSPVVKAFIITNTGSGQAVGEHEPSLFSRPVPPPLKDLMLRELETQGIVRTLLYAPHGDVHGAVLDDGTQVRIPPHARYQLSGLLQVGKSIRVIGYGTETRFGRTIEATTMQASTDDARSPLP